MLFNFKCYVLLSPIDLHFFLDLKSYILQVIDRYIREGKIQGVQQQQQAKKHAKLVLLLDCWPVNVSKEFREWVAATYSFILLRYIPAGLTGGWQINDAYLHRPLKLSVRVSAEDWYCGEMAAALEQLSTGVITEVELGAFANSLMSIKTLRDNSVHWVVKALAEISKVDEDGNTLILKGTITNFPVPFNESS